MCRVTVLMGIYNCASTLAEALNSLYSQTFQDFKIVLCEDGSSDDTYEVARTYALKHDNIILIRNEKNMGLNYTLNRCLEYADTEYCARMDGDDVSLPTRFEKEVKFLDTNREYAVVSAPMIHFDENGNFRYGKGRGEVTKFDFIHGTPICHAPCMARTSVIKSVGGYSVGRNFIRVEDYHLWYKIYASGHKLYMLNECLYKMRDDRNAKARRSWIGRKNTFLLMNMIFRKLNLPWWTHFYSLRPILTYCLPDFIYNYLHRRD